MPDDPKQFELQVFVNCPFDEDYKSLLRALIFTVLACDLIPRIASDQADSGQVRLEKIRNLIRSCHLSIHDLSRMEPLKAGDLPRFNMPFELGLDLGCKSYGEGTLSTKQCLILERERYRYQRVLSDIAGNDIRAHGEDPETMVREVRNWLRTVTNKNLPSGNRIWRSYNEFTTYLEDYLRASGFSEQDIDSLEIPELLQRIQEWKSASQAT